MNHILRTVLTACVLVTLTLSHGAFADGLKVGDVAPDFALKGSDGQTHRLSDYRGKTVVLAWFPKTFTGG